MQVKEEDMNGRGLDLILSQSHVALVLVLVLGLSWSQPIKVLALTQVLILPDLGSVFSLYVVYNTDYITGVL